MSAAPEPSTLPSVAELVAGLQRAGHVFLTADAMQPLLTAQGALTDWPAFVASWDGMPIDTYMADGGRYRRRLYAVYAADDTGRHRGAHQPHYQGLEYNPLNGDVARWFEPITPAIGDGPTMHAVLGFCHGLFGRLAPATRRWHVEVHQFRIEAVSGESGKPTPEGVHRDGVDYVLVLLVRRHNIASGTTTIHSPDGADLGSFTLQKPFDATLIDDRRVYHGVTPVQPIDAAQPAFRDVLVVTFRGLAA
ncbi:MAG: hypothetical protein JWQ90_5074 [Hydrocarboniphaga sp.]|uniref:2OG-Fe dioxygenase family protein n=1 Tax=Hydrocarboniphaga sp. TaxID=2033016 RepID=UPI00262C4B90|nr:2OG-Fe dioxygenase family protein [Hydrocarboniphaga sp.]MDB5972624.1 hypothetical protein [Hydrocarboniphaga sp.]